MACCDEPKKTAKYVCSACGKEEVKEDQGCAEVTSCCGKPMTKKDDCSCSG